MLRLNMLFEIASSRERRFTVTTTIRSVISVNMKVKFQIGQFIKSFITQTTVIRFFTSVNQEVISKIAFLMETFVTDITHEFFLFAVSTNVRLQRRATVERLLAHVAFMRFIAGVNDLMSTESARQTKPFATDITDKRTSSSMTGHFEMNGQRVFCFKSLATLLASVDRFHSGCRGGDLSRLRCV